ncbi:hypothetical protein A2483_02595 [Candidatus Peregrinibacteria bacterium RIFOXYC2_FULL_33_13]|nr:MAG: hypothetical protein UR27_C0027G0017 [Candidatus Peregrinibacteria bacterium GW2011_GWA2_33_10]KKP40141.1 MAG: hypothetical protein UR30_C0006G0046 [Candidatus Peregrinibacteria bacterium GW2011_GWC2_33_13]OGJ47762.1 MAG: hypothetical protein A2229_04940 [Candidatus Peregrinibacteria bacterium RIFOXYA2_FULL_33_7]OGJ53762.1 MAG: hypothetical protein A2483_02595 [Candidatus Peregrinibacteria bacterium RIFOXYC2_FULL_33_13]
MPNFDKTGPIGQGPKTGRQLGSCNENRTSNVNGRCMRMGRKNSQLTLEEEEKFLKNRLEEIRGLKEDSNT